MSRSRSFLSRLAVPAIVFATLTLATPAYAASPAWSPKLAYVLTTGSVRSVLVEKLHLTKAQDRRLRTIGFDLERAQDAVQRRSDLIVMDDGRTLQEKRAAIAAIGYNGTLESAEESAAARAAAVTGLTIEALGTAVSEVWQEDAAEHNLQTSLTAMGLTPQAIVGSFHVYATRFYDQYSTTFGVALPDRYLKAANNGRTRPGYPAGTYAVSIYWDGVHHGRDNNVSETWSTPHSVASAKVVDVGPWNLDDNYWNSYSDPDRPRRINNADNKDDYGRTLTALAGLGHIAFGLPESQAAYFNYYGRPAKIPAHSDSPENYWDKPRGYNGQWSGADEFGRQVTQPAAVDLCPPVYAAMGMTDNEWVDIVPLWEARLELVGDVKTTAGPYITGQNVSFTFTVKNAGSLSATWDAVTMTLIEPDGKAVNATYQGPITLARGATKTFTFTHTLDKAGTVRARPNARRASVWSRIGGTDVSLGTVLQRTTDRLSGANRYDTAVQISKAAYPKGADTVVIATGLDYPDALTGAVLAHAEDAPLLLVGRTAAPSVTAEIQRLMPSKVIVLGGPSSVSTDALGQVVAAAPGVPVLRLAGANRYATARLIAEEVVKHSGGLTPDGTAVIATGRGFADAMSVSALAAEKGWPILLTDTSRVPTDTTAAMTAIGATKTLVIGSDKVVSADVAKTLPSPTRLGGATRYDTAGLIADYAESKGVLDYGYCALTLGSAYPDGLTGAVLAACRQGTLLLTPRDYLAGATKTRLQRHRTVTTHMQAFGSTDAVSAEALTQAVDALR